MVFSPVVSPPLGRGSGFERELVTLAQKRMFGLWTDVERSLYGVSIAGSWSPRDWLGSLGVLLPDKNNLYVLRVYLSVS